MLGLAWHVLARPGAARRGRDCFYEFHCSGKARRSQAGPGWVGHGEASHGEDSFINLGSLIARYGPVARGRAGHGKAGQVKARILL
jgi:hypothetical protein